MRFADFPAVIKRTALRISVTILLLAACLVPISESAHAAAVGCTVGSSSSCPGDSAWQIKQATGTNTNGIYWVTLNGSAVKVYAIMDSAMGGGGWMLAMKGASNGTSFPYSANYCNDICRS